MTPNEARMRWFNEWPQFGTPLAPALTIVCVKKLADSARSLARRHHLKVCDY